MLTEESSSPSGAVCLRRTTNDSSSKDVSIDSSAAECVEEWDMLAARASVEILSKGYL